MGAALLGLGAALGLVALGFAVLAVLVFLGLLAAFLGVAGFFAFLGLFVAFLAAAAGFLAFLGDFLAAGFFAAALLGFLAAAGFLAAGFLALGAAFFLVSACFLLILKEPEGTGSFHLQQGAFGHQALDGDLDAGVVLLHVVAAGGESFLQRGEGHAAPLIGRGHGFDDQISDGWTCFLGFGSGLLLGHFGRRSGNSWSGFCHFSERIYSLSNTEINECRSIGAALLNNT